LYSRIIVYCQSFGVNFDSLSQFAKLHEDYAEVQSTRDVGRCGEENGFVSGYSGF
jgi:hypothetical protein